MDRIKCATAEDYGKFTKEQLCVEIADRNDKDGSPNFKNVKPADTKDVLITALVEDDKHIESKPGETPEVKSAGRAVEIPKVSARKMAEVQAHNPPTDDQFTFHARRLSDGDLYAVAVHGPNTYGRTHTAKNSESYWDGTAAQFREQFDREDA